MQRIISLSSVSWLVSRGTKLYVWPNPEWLYKVLKWIELFPFSLLLLVALSMCRERYSMCSHMDQSNTYHIFQFHCVTLAGNWHNPWRRMLNLKTSGYQEILIASVSTSINKVNPSLYHEGMLWALNEFMYAKCLERYLPPHHKLL